MRTGLPGVVFSQVLVQQEFRCGACRALGPARGSGVGPVGTLTEVFENRSVARLRSFSSSLALSAALAACADGASRGLVAPDTRPVLDLAATVGDESFPLRSSAAHGRVVSAQQTSLGTSTRGRATGRGAMTYLSSLQQYSFTATSLGGSSPTKGTMTAILLGAAVRIEIEARVDCLFTVGNQSWVSGPIDRFVLNGVDYQATVNLVARVQDNGEGAGASPDLVSPPFTGGPQACLTAPALPLLPDAVGNVQLLAR